MSSNEIKDTAETIKGIVEAVPIYQDLAQPTVQEVGKNLHTLSKLVTCALAPVRKRIWEWEQIEENLKGGLEEKLKDTKPENIITPDLRVAGPLLESLRFTAQEDELREMYTSLLASSMNKNKQNEVHPSFVEIIRQLQPDEARALKEIYLNQGTLGLLDINLKKDKGGTSNYLYNFCKLYNLSEIVNKRKIPLYIENLERLKLVNIPKDDSFTDKEYHYKPLKENSEVKFHISNLEKKELKYEFKEKALLFTNFGKDFIKVCL